MAQGLYIEGSDEFRKLAAQLKGPAHKTLRKELNRSLKKSAEPAVKSVRTAVRGIKVTTTSRGGSGTRQRHEYLAARSKTGRTRARGLRDTIASATTLRAKYSGYRPSVKIIVRKSALPPDQRQLPKYLNGARPWRHPVFGTDEWVSQKGQPYFEVSIRKHADKMRQEILKAIRETAAKIAASAK